MINADNKNSNNVINLDTLVSQKSSLLLQQIVDGKKLLVKDTVKYRWFEYAGDSVQSLMNKERPQDLITPISQSLLLFLLLPNSYPNILNLGLGGASLERALAVLPNVSITSIEASQSIIDMCNQFFLLPEKVQVIKQKAENFIVQTPSLYDVVICDLYIGEQNPEFMFTESFYVQLRKVMTNTSVAMFSFHVKTEGELIQVLLKIKKQFSFVTLMDFDDYSNIVVMCSTHEIPNKKELQGKLQQLNYVNFTYLSESINRMRYI